MLICFVMAPSTRDLLRKIEWIIVPGVESVLKVYLKADSFSHNFVPAR